MTPKPNGDDDETTAEQVVDAADAGAVRSGERERDALDDILEQFGEQPGYRLQLERIDPVDGPAYLGTLPLNSELVALVEQRYGGGKYGGKVVDSKSKYVRRFPIFRIAGDARDPRSAASTQPAAAGGESTNIVQAVAAALSGFRESIVDAIRAAQPAPVAPAADPLAMLTRAVELVKTMQPPAAPAQTSNVVGMMRDLMELQNELRPERDDSGGVASVMRDYLPIVQQTLSNRNQETVNPVRVDVAPAQPQPIVADWLRPYMQYRGLLLQLADSGQDPTRYAGIMADQVTDEQATLIARAQAAGEMERDLFAAVPQLSQSDQRRRFAGALLETLRVELFGEPKMRQTKKRKRPAKKAAGVANG